jgi:hypothetical protein
MPQKASPYRGTNVPARVSLSHQQLVQGLKGLKIRAPNKSLSSQGYKSALPKLHEGESS